MVVQARQVLEESDWLLSLADSTELIAGVVGIGAPVFHPDGRLLGSMYVSIPEQRFAERREDPIAASLLACCSAFTNQLARGWTG